MSRRAIMMAVPALAALGPAGLAAMPAKGAARAHTSSATAITVRMGEYFFRPRTVTVKTGRRVRFVNVGKIEHTVADATAGGKILSRVIHPRPLKHGASQTVTFRRAGVVHYVCTFHPSLMKGVVKVVR